MNIALFGYGKMGKTIEKIAVDRGHAIVLKVDHHNMAEFENFDKSKIDCAIEFTMPEAAFDNIKRCIDHNIPVLSGTTGWLDKKPEIDQYCLDHQGSFFYASNYSIGVNIFFKLNAFLAKIMNKQADYKVGIHEIHHTEKLDSPSGTAISIADGLLEHLEDKNGWKETHTPANNEIGITAERIAGVPGTHIVKFDSEVDEIEIKHTAHNRQGFALGAVLVAEWIINQKGTLSMKDFISF